MQHLAFRLLLLSALGLPAASALAAKCPNLHIVVDRSGSMSAALPGGSRMSVARDAVTTVINTYDGRFPIGFSSFPKSNCDSDIAVQPDYGTKAAIKMAVDRLTASGSTPSGTAVRDAAAMMKLRDPDRKQYILLITDGGPGCGGEPDTATGTVNEITKARMQSPSITTFVVGFGGGLSTTERDTLSRMAEAGGRAAPTPEKFYKADDAAGLSKALQDIVEVVMDEFGDGTCDDSCYSNGCPTPGDVCIRGECKPNPCVGVNCGKDQYCYTDGTTPGTCVRACAKGCPKGTRCSQGSCISDPCGYACPATTVCDPQNKRCLSDPLCENLPDEKKCRRPSQCQFGECVDDPCTLITCPANTQCVRWDGSCIPKQNPTSPDMGMGGGEEPDNRRGGCATTPGGASAAPLASLLTFLLVVLALRRRAR